MTVSPSKTFTLGLSVFGSLKTLAAFTSSLISRPLRFGEGF